MAVDGFEWDAPGTPASADAFGYAGGSAHPSAFPKVRVVTLSGCGSHAKARAGPGDRRRLGRAGPGPLPLPPPGGGPAAAGRPRTSPPTGWCQAADTCAGLLWRVAGTVQLPVLDAFDVGSSLSVVLDAAVRGAARERLLRAAQDGQALPPGRARYVRVIEYEVARSRR